MQVKVFEAPDMASGLKMIRKELGPDALILSTRTVKSGKLGLLGKQHFEITAAIDNEYSHVPQSKEHPPIHNYVHHSYAQNQQHAAPLNAPHHLADPQQDILSKKKDVNSKTLQIDTPQAPPHAEGQLREEFDELKNLVKSLAGQITRIHNTSDSVSSAPGNTFHNLERKLLSTRSNGNIEDILLGQGINPETARVISTFACEQLNETEISDPTTLLNFLQQTIADIITIQSPDFSQEHTQKKIALIGPTGVGKTTTLAKIAAKYLSTVSSSIALITIDTYRIAAVEQLKVYGEIMNLPVEVVITPSQLADSLEKHKDKELILIDTAGRSHLDDLSIRELESFLSEDLEIENHLVLSATTRDEELLEAINTFRSLSVHSTIFTKIDECSRLGVILNTQVKNGSPISFITNGQRVPEDILELDSKYLAQLIVPSENG